MAKKGYFSAENSTWRELPSGYTQVEFIQSSGTQQYIDTGFKPNNNTRVVMDFRINARPMYDHVVIFGARDAANVNSFCVFYIKNGYFRSDYGTTNTNQWDIDVFGKYTIDKNKETTSLGGTTQSYSATTFQCNYNLYLFRLNTGGSGGFGCDGLRVFSCKIYDNGTLIRDYVPCLNANGVAGLYDAVNGVFYENAGTGSFLAGNQVHNDVAREPKKVYFSDNGVARKAKKAYFGDENGIAWAVKKAYFGDENGIARRWYASDVPINTLAVGSSVFMNVSGTAKEFLVVHQGIPDSTMYDASCEGTWLLMKDIYTKIKWDSTDSDYANSSIHAYLNDSFFNQFDSNIQSIIKQVKLPYCPTSGNRMDIAQGSNGISAKIFLLSTDEVGRATYYKYKYGARLAYFSDSEPTSNWVAYLGSTATHWWLRIPYNSSKTQVACVHSSGNGSYSECTSTSVGVRPALILPSDALVDENFNVIG